MPSNPHLDATDVEILRLLQDDGRLTTAELARAIHMSPTSTADRVRRLVDQGVILGYRAVVAPAAVGYPVDAFIRLRLNSPAGEPFQRMLDANPEIREAHHVTGDDCYLLRVASGSLDRLESLTDTLAAFGRVTTNLVFSTRTKDRPLLPDAA